MSGPFQTGDRVEVVNSEGVVRLGWRGSVCNRQLIIERVAVMFDDEFGRGGVTHWVWEENLRRLSLVDEIAELDRPEPIQPITGEGG